MASQFDEELAKAFAHAIEEIGSGATIIFQPAEGDPVEIEVIVDTATVSSEKINGGRRDQIEVTVFIKEADLTAAGIQKGSRLEIPCRDLTVRVEKIGKYAGGKRSLDCVGLNRI